MSKYQALGAFLRRQTTEQVPMTFAEIERVTGAKLPNSKRYPAWWSNNTWNNVMTKIWLDAGFRTEQVDIDGQKLVFRRSASGVGTRERYAKEKIEGKQEYGMSDEGRHFQPAERGAKTPFRSPLWGALKGTFTIESGWDLTKPMLDPEELAEMDANLDRTADMIEQDLKVGRK